MDDKKQRRMQSNRESARRSRMKQQKLLKDLRSDNLKKDFMISKLQIQIIGLTDQLRSRDFLLQTLKEVTGFAFDVPDDVASDHLLQQLQAAAVQLQPSCV